MDSSCLACSLVELRSAQQASAIQYAVAAKMLAAERQNGAAVTKLIAAAGTGVDNAAERVASAVASGGGLDVVA
ncbi:MAG: hypothetical protein U1A27_11120 [Phycisphaerae bacterium]